MRKLIHCLLSAALLILFFHTNAAAQTHPCDITPPANQTTSIPFGFGVCAPNIVPDSGGIQTVISHIVVRSGTTVLFDTPLTKVTSVGVSATGFSYWETAKTLVIPSGIKNTTLALRNTAGESPRIPFDFTVVDSLPPSPSLPRIVRQ